MQERQLYIKLIHTSISILKYRKITYLNVGYMVISSSVFFPLFLFNSRGSFISALIFFLLLLFNLRKFVIDKLNEFEVKVDQINRDTYSEKSNFFSYRRSTKLGHKDYGRCISTVCML